MHPKINSGNSDCRCGNKSGININAGKCLLLVAAIALLAGCASPPIARNARIEDREVLQGHTQAPSQYPGNSGDSSTPYNERGYQIERAEYYQQLADDSGAETGPQAIDAALSAAEFYIQANNTQRAGKSIAQLDLRQLNEQQRNRYDIVLAYTEYARQEYRVALNRLQAVFSRSQAESEINHAEGVINNAESFNPQLVDALLLASFCYQELNEFGSAVAMLVEREALLFGAARAETSRYIWQVIEALSPEQRQSVIQSTANSRVRSRFEQSLQGQVSATQTSPNQFDQWRNNAPTAENNLLDGQWSPGAPKNIAVLLPITSRFNKAAQAVKDGIEYQHSLNLSAYRPRLAFYDIGDNPLQTSQYYAAARQSGADLIIGPLGKDYANQLSSYAAAYEPDSGVGYGNRDSIVPTILLGGDHALKDHFCRLTLSPERQAKIVADRALALGYVNAALLISSDDTASRTAEAFSRYWLASGGKLSNSVTYSDQQFDHSTELKQLFNINQSEYRHNRLSSALGYKPVFAAYRRDDIDFIFMIAGNDAGRIVRPQINFFSGEKLPVLATASVYNGIPDPINNVDLDQTAFPVMPWVLMSNDVAPYAGQLNMLFAMGSDAYRLSTSLRRMQQNPRLALQGNMGILNIETSGEVAYRPVWARFKDGIAETDNQFIPLTDPFFIQGSTGQGDHPGRQNGKGSYNESNWDHRQSRRKTGS